MTTLATFTHTPGGPAHITLNRPDARNALSIDLIKDLHASVRAAAASNASVLVIRGEGKAFCAGMDLKAVLNDPDAPGQLLMSLAELCLAIRSLPMVVIASVNGAAIGGGCGLACVCDLAITHADSKMGFPEVDLGVCPAVVAPWLVRKIGPGKARRVLLSGGLMSGREAHALGIVDHLVDTREQLDDATNTLAARLNEGGYKALAATKQLLNTLDGSLDEAQSREGARLSAKVLALPEAKEMLAKKLSK